MKLALAVSCWGVDIELEDGVGNTHCGSIYMTLQLAERTKLTTITLAAQVCAHQSDLPPDATQLVRS
jgi:hypothetical protein